MSLTFVLGGARSGKSRYAQAAAESYSADHGARLSLVATATAGDAEMAERIARHQAERSAAWRTVEAPLRLAEALATFSRDDAVVVDCLTLWLSNSMAEHQGHGARLEGLIPALAACPARLWLVSNEVGWGIVPDNALARRFRDEAGRAHQRIAALAEDVVLVVAGLPLTLKGAPAPIAG